ncbi:hypothetical protein GCM10029964_063720 [Kibdelosporangium lantanae]
MAAFAAVIVTGESIAAVTASDTAPARNPRMVRNTSVLTSLGTHRVARDGSLGRAPREGGWPQN